MTNACTIVARNYLPYARVLAASFLAHHPHGQFRVLLIDDEDGWLDRQPAGLHCHRLSEIGLSPRDVSHLAAIYDVTELATAVKPQFLRFLLTSGWDHVIYLDPDIKVFASLAPVAELASQHGIVLTPHMTRPLPRDGRRIDDAHILSSGMFNLGFIALGTPGAPGAPGRDTGAFLDWWWSRTRRDALIEPHLEMFTDQRWIDYAPVFFAPHIIKSAAVNVAYWNLHEREVTWTGERYMVGEEPLVFFHFSGFNVDIPYLLSRHQGDRPRILLSERPALRRLCAEYRDELLAAGVADAPPSYGWARLTSGLPFDKRMRRLYREGLEAAERGLALEPPAPFDDEAAFITWLNEPVAAGPRPRVSRYLYRVYLDRPDLQEAFPDLTGVDAARYFLWLPRDGVAQEHIPAVLLPPLDAPVADVGDQFAGAAELQPGVNLAGYFRAELGIGEAARLIRAALEVAGVPHATFAHGQTENRQQHPYTPAGDGRAPYDVNLLCVNADRTPEFARAVGPQFFRGRHTIGYWFWELEQFPAEMHAGFDAVDEVWAATRFVAAAVDRIGRRPVHHIPLGVPVPVPAAGVTRERLGLPPGFVFLFMFDFFSAIERKNPLGLVRAFRRAFREGEATLVLKSINGDRRLGELEQLRAAVADRADILVIDRYYDAAWRYALLASADCYVSLHRSEGFGLTLAEAMALGKPVIATGYSGNVDFMDAANSYLVDYTRVSVPASGGPYACGTWAEPRDDDAATQLRRVFEARDEAATRAARGRETVQAILSPAASAAAIARRLDAIRQRRPVLVVGASESRDAASAMAVPSDVGDRTVARVASVVAARPGVPATGWSERLRQAARRAVERALGPYWRQRQLNARLLRGLGDVRALAERAAAREPDQERALAAVWTAFHAAEASAHAHDTHASGRLARVERALDDLDAALRGHDEALREHHEGLRGHDGTLLEQDAALQGHDKTLREQEAALRGHEETLREQEAALHGHDETLREQEAALRGHDQTLLEQDAALQGHDKTLREQEAALHGHDETLRDQDVALRGHAAVLRVYEETLRAHEEALRAQGDALTLLVNRLYAVPYMDDPQRFERTRPDGQRVLGYQGRRPSTRGDDYRTFEDIFRGPESLIRERLKVYVPLLSGRGPIVDLGCGRGEMLDLLRDAGVAAQGVDIDAAMIRRCREKGHVATQCDALEFLASQPDASLGAVFAAQVVEHLPHDEFREFLCLSRTKLKSEGCFIMETVNPHCLEAFRTFWTDLTHVKPIFPEVALAWCWLSGFEQAEVVFPGGSGNLDEDRRLLGQYAVVAQPAVP